IPLYSFLIRLSAIYTLFPYTTLFRSSGNRVAVKPCLFHVVIPYGVDDIEHHTDQDDEHTEGNGDDKHGVEGSHKRNIHHGSHGFQPYGVENFLETEEAAVHESEKDGEDTGAADDAGKVHMFFLIQDQSAQEQDQSLPHVSEHGTEDQGVGDGHEPGGIHLIVGRQAVHLYIHFKGPEKPRILQLGGRFFLRGDLL